MIIKQIPLTTTLGRTGTSVKLCFSSNSIPEPKPLNDINYCEYECQQEYYAFSFTEESESDFFTIAEPVILDSDTAEFILIKCGVEYPITDDTYADIIANDKMNYCTVQWHRVYNSLGGGRYTIQSKRTSLGVEETQVFGVFLVVPFDEKTANDTLVVEGVLNGSLENFGDFESDNVPYFMRFTGHVLSQDSRESERVLQANRVEVNSHKRKHQEYEIEVNHVGFEFQNYLKNVWLMVDEIYVKSYFIMSPLYLEKVRILVNETEIKEGVGSRNLDYLISAEDSVKNIIWHPKD